MTRTCKRDTIKKPNLQILGVEEREDVQTKDIDDILNKVTAINANFESHPATGGFQNIKQTRSEKRYL
jgi:hypothetical protein